MESRLACIFACIGAASMAGRHLPALYTQLAAKLCPPQILIISRRTAFCKSSD